MPQTHTIGISLAGRGYAINILCICHLTVKSSVLSLENCFWPFIRAFQGSALCLWHLIFVKRMTICCYSFLTPWYDCWTEMPLGPNAKGALHLQHNLLLCLPGQSPLLGLGLIHVRSSVSRRWRNHNASPFLEQDTAVLFLSLTVLKMDLVDVHLKDCLFYLVPFIQTKNSVSVPKNGAHWSESKVMLMSVQFSYSE